MLIPIAMFFLVNYFYVVALLLPLAPILYAEGGMFFVRLIILITVVIGLLLTLITRIKKGEESIEIIEIMEESYKEKMSRISFVIFSLYSFLSPVNTFTGTIRAILLLPFIFDYEEMYFNPLMEACGVKAYRAKNKEGEVIIVISPKEVKVGTIQAKRAGSALWVRTGE